MTFDRLRQIVRLRLRSLFSGASVDRELDEELRYHLEQQIEANIRARHDADRGAHARRSWRSAACEQPPNSAGTNADFRVVDCRGGRHAFRSARCSSEARYLRSSPSPSLALGIGAFLAIFQLVDAIRLRTLPVDDAARARRDSH